MDYKGSRVEVTVDGEPIEGVSEVKCSDGLSERSGDGSGGSIEFEAGAVELDRLLEAAQGERSTAEMIADELNRPPGGEHVGRPRQNLELGGLPEGAFDGWYFWGAPDAADPLPPVSKVINVELVNGAGRDRLVWAPELSKLEAVLVDELDRGASKSMRRMEKVSGLIISVRELQRQAGRAAPDQKAITKHVSQYRRVIREL